VPPRAHHPRAPGPDLSHASPSVGTEIDEEEFMDAPVTELDERFSSPGNAPTSWEQACEVLAAGGSR
jgi:hypothetical protein